MRKQDGESVAKELGGSIKVCANKNNLAALKSANIPICFGYAPWNILIFLRHLSSPIKILSRLKHSPPRFLCFGYVRFDKGAGPPKREEDFAAEIAKMVQG